MLLSGNQISNIRMDVFLYVCVSVCLLLVVVVIGLASSASVFSSRIFLQILLVDTLVANNVENPVTLFTRVPTRSRPGECDSC